MTINRSNYHQMQVWPLEYDEEEGSEFFRSIDSKSFAPKLPVEETIDSKNIYRVVLRSCHKQLIQYVKQ